MREKYYLEIREKFGNKVFLDFAACEFTSYKTGGLIKVLFYPENSKDIIDMLDFIKTKKINYFICGRATNILVSDLGYDGVFIKTDKINSFSFDNNILKADAGCLLDEIIVNCVEKSLSGLEKLSYIPGSVGGAIKMNAGAFGCEIFDRLEYFDCINTLTFEFERKFKRDIKYGYRYVESIDDLIILNAVFSLDKGDVVFLKNIRNEIIRKRESTQPLDYPSAGSVFKRPKGDYASRLIDISGLKGKRYGGACVSEKHAGFIINLGNATSSDIYSLIKIIRDEVFKKTGIKLELEQILVGEFY
ncbi:MAG: UDP-N-acetylmuramate dehydrogenase [Elusimicrobiales bacterium]|nr:UDP-N-acetylmuramate dehydrogenase [Elusimicrobiales bacterium]